jgi:putative transposase
LIVPDLPLHIVQRGNDRMMCFRQESDRLVYLALARDVAEKTGCAVHAYCLMSNHVHLLLTPSGVGGCAALMHALAQRYAQYFNRKYQRTGTLWEGRYKSCVIESSGYILGCYRYIELNPVRAKIVSHPASFPWSSCPGNSGIRNDALLSPHAEFAALEPAAYAQLLSDGMPHTLLHEIREATHGGYPLGTESFKAGLFSPGGRRLVRGKPGRPGKTATQDAQVKSVPDPDLFSGGGAF